MATSYIEHETNCMILNNTVGTRLGEMEPEDKIRMHVSAAVSTFTFFIYLGALCVQEQ